MTRRPSDEATLRHHALGWNDVMVARKFGCSPTVVWKIRRRLGLKSNYRSPASREEPPQAAGRRRPADRPRPVPGHPHAPGAAPGGGRRVASRNHPPGGRRAGRDRTARAAAPAKPSAPRWGCAGRFPSAGSPGWAARGGSFPTAGGPGGGPSPPRWPPGGRRSGRRRRDAVGEWVHAVGRRAG
jgi:hypothetical protein